MENLKIQPMNESDLNILESSFDTDFECTWKFNTLKSEFSNPSSIYVVAYLDNELVGFAGIWLSVDDAHITNIVTKKNHRGKGIGSKLLEHLILLTKQNYKASLTLEVNTKNTSAQGLYNKYNFKNLGVRKKYYNGIEDAFIMTLYI